MRNTLPFLKEEYFSGQHKIIFHHIRQFIENYNNRPTVEAVELSLDELPISNEEKNKLKEITTGFREYEEPNMQWLMDSSEEFCKQQAIENAIISSMKIIGDPKTKMDKGMIPELMKNALSVSFDPSIGHEYIEDVEKRYELYHTKVDRIPFDIDYLNQITGGGLPKKTLNIISAGVNVGKSLAMCHFSASYLLQNKNVLYISLEMAEERVAERIDANLMDVSLNTLKEIPKEQYLKLMKRVKEKCTGKLFIKEFPTATASVIDFRRLLNELKLKKNFIPDVIVIDYLNICVSSRIKNNGVANSYTIVKSIAEELRGLAIEYNVPIISATQLNRNGMNSSDVSMTDIAESIGVAATADFMMTLINTAELEQCGQIMCKQLKNRYDDVTTHKKQILGIDRTKQRLFNVGNVITAVEDSELDSTDLMVPSNIDKFNGFNFTDEE